MSFLFSSGLADIVNTTLYQTRPIFTGLGHGKLYHINPLKTAEITAIKQSRTLQWRHNGRSGVSNHQPHDCLLNRLFRRRSKETSKLRVTGLCVRDSPMSGEFLSQMASNAENVSIWWRHHDKILRLFNGTYMYSTLSCCATTVFPYMTPLSNGNTFRVIGPLWGKSIGQGRIPLTEGQ